MGTSDEVRAFHWMTPEEIGSAMDPAYACRILDAIDSSGATYRSHDEVSLLDS